MTTMTKTAALKASNVFTPVSGGVMFPHDMDDPNGPYTVVQCNDDDAPKLARRMRVAFALELMGCDTALADRLAEDECRFGGRVRDCLNSAWRRIAH